MVCFIVVVFVVICLVWFDVRCEVCLGCDAGGLSLCLRCLFWLIRYLVVCGFDLLVILFWVNLLVWLLGYAWRLVFDCYERALGLV